MKKKPQRLPRYKYASYINSAEWRATRQRYFNSKMPQSCLVCDNPKVDLHHRTYDRLGNEWLADLVPLCREHHNECHSFIKDKKRPLKSGTNAYLKHKDARWHGPNGKNLKFRVKTGRRTKGTQCTL